MLQPHCCSPRVEETELGAAHIVCVTMLHDVSELKSAFGSVQAHGAAPSTRKDTSHTTTALHSTLAMSKVSDLAVAQNTVDSGKKVLINQTHNKKKNMPVIIGTVSFRVSSSVLDSHNRFSRGDFVTFMKKPIQKNELQEQNWKSFCMGTERMCLLGRNHRHLLQ